MFFSMLATLRFSSLTNGVVAMVKTPAAALICMLNVIICNYSHWPKDVKPCEL